MRRFERLLVCLLAVVLIFPPVGAQEEDEPEWPQEIERKGYTVTVYQPQPESFKGNKLTGRAAVSVTAPDDSEPRFGAVWIEATVETDRAERVVSLVDLKIPKVRFPDAPEDKVKRLTDLLEKHMITWAPEISLDRLLTTLEAADVQKTEAKKIRNDPPTVILVTEPTELVMLSGKPELRPVKDSTCMKVINTQHFILLDPGTKAYYMNLGELWMTAPDLKKGPWTESKKTPDAVAKLTPPYEKTEDEEKIVPAVMVVDEPTELVTCDGEPKFVPLEGNELLYVSNTDASLVMVLATQTYYLQSSGRWFSSKSWKLPWTYVPQDKLPELFRKIPPDSDIGDLRVFVAGTNEAKDAVLDAQIPQTAAIKRDDKSLQVTYDGDPVFEDIGGDTNHLGYAINTEYAVIRDNKAASPVFYCCWNAVWYTAPSPTGPWRVATEVPSDIYLIPTDCPIYNVTYVRIYKVEPTVVYVGYTSGYLGCYVYGGTVIYGTGYPYTVWVGTVYVARPVTYGWGYRYSPLVGRWFSPFSVGGVVRRTRRRTRRRVHRRHDYHYDRHRDNVYDRHKNRAEQKRDRKQDQVDRKRDRKQNQPKADRKNNHYADRNGNVHRRNENGSWQKKDKNGWSNTQDNKSRERDYNSRQRGNSRSHQYNQSRSRSGGARRGGGGRRR
ncbi:MAG: hypothetical protein ACYTHK_07865 [Planctomycetota bacterium]|jgi:hypothetical protein